MMAFFAIVIGFLGTSCNRVEPNYEGVKQSNYGANGLADLKVVTGAQGILTFGEELYQVPMFVQTGDAQAIHITAADGGEFTVDPSFTYRAIRGKGPEIVYNYKNYLNMGVRSTDSGVPLTILDNIAVGVLHNAINNAYKDAARRFTSDSLTSHMTIFEDNVSDSLRVKFRSLYFELETITSGLQVPESMRDAINRKNISKQETLLAKNDLEKSEMLRRKALIDAQTMEIRSRVLSKEILAEKWINAIEKTQNKVIITDGKTPVMLMGQ